MGGGGKTPNQAEAGDGVFYSRNSSQIVIIPKEEIMIGAIFPNSYVPIGVVAIPGKHGVYGYGICGVISLVNMSCDTPDTGTTSVETMYWGVNTDTNNENYTKLPYVGLLSSPGNSSGTITGEYYFGWLPSDKFSFKQCPHDTNAYYDDNVGSAHYAVPSPYLTNGNRNTGYYRIASPSSTDNCLSAFYGPLWNKNIVENYATGQSSWKTASHISNLTSVGHYPAVCCCWRYHTEGTNQGDWYLPSVAEMGYVVARFNQINSTMRNLMSLFYGKYSIAIIASKDTWTSTEYNETNIRHVYFNEGYVHYSARNTSKVVRAMMQLY